MLKLNPPTERPFLAEKPKSKKITEKLYLEKVPYSREEENVLLLDIAKYHVDDEPFSDEYEELLEINRIFKKKKTNIANNSTHPWAITPEPIKHHVKDIGIIAYLPYDLTVNNVKKGTFKLFGYRNNTFGAAPHNQYKDELVRTKCMEKIQYSPTMENEW